MRGNIDSPAVVDASVSHVPQAASISRRFHWMRWRSAAALLLVAIAFLLLGGREIEHVAQVERLAAKVERARTLAPETKDVIDRLVLRLEPASASDGSAQALRRKAAIERITAAVGAKDIASTDSGGQEGIVNPSVASAY